MPAPKQTKRKKPEILVDITTTEYTNACRIEITISGDDAIGRDLMADYIVLAIKEAADKSVA
jgi:hypothetical protein